MNARWICVAAGCAFALAGATPAGAAQIGVGETTGPLVSGHAVDVVGAPGENNDVTVKATDPITAIGAHTGWPLTVTVSDPNATFDPTPPTGDIPCQIVSAHEARCSAPAGDYFVQALLDLGDGDNRVRFATGSVPLRERFTTGDGNDDISTGPFAGDTNYRWASSTGGGNDSVRIGLPVRDGFGDLPGPAVPPLGLAVNTGAGDDFIFSVNGAFDQVNCDTGNDTLIADPTDSESLYVEPEGSCETRVPAAAG